MKEKQVLAGPTGKPPLVKTIAGVKRHILTHVRHHSSDQGTPRGASWTDVEKEVGNEGQA